jgi:hypothetical protein
VWKTANSNFALSLMSTSNRLSLHHRGEWKNNKTKQKHKQQQKEKQEQPLIITPSWRMQKQQNKTKT